MGYQNEIDFSKRSILKAGTVWGLAAVFYLYELMLLVSPSVMVDDLSLTFRTSAEQLGSLAAFYYYAYALMQIPVGLLMDRYGPRLLLTIAAMLCAFGSVTFGHAHSLEMAEWGRFTMGIGGSFAVVGFKISVIMVSRESICVFDRLNGGGGDDGRRVWSSTGGKMRDVNWLA